MSAANRSRVVVALGLGGNLGQVEDTFKSALDRLSEVVADLQVASLYRSRAVSPIPQPDFLNTAAVGATELAPLELLALSKELERAAGRQPGPRYGPRPLDIDVLLYDAIDRTSEQLTLPHPGLRERRFVLAPLAEIAPHWLVPPDQVTIRELLDRLGPSTAADRVQPFGWSARLAR